MNIKEVAKKAGVSVATVSRVMNHPENVAPATKEKIETVMEEFGYMPNWFARGLNFNRTNTIGLLIPNMLNPGYIEIAKGVEDVAHQKGYMTLLCNVENDSQKEKKYIDALINRKIDGIVLVSSMLNCQEVESIMEQDVPVVIIGENKEMSPEIPMVRIDCENAAYKAVKHLIDIGYEDIAIIYGSTPEQENLRKLKGYRQALKENDLQEKEIYSLEVANSIHGGYIAGKKIIDMEKRPRAIFASSDLLAMGAIDAMRDFEVKIPEDIAIVGFDNIQMSNLIEPKLTTIAKPLHKMGVIGSRLLFDIMEGRDDDEKVIAKEILLQSKLKIRKSCGHKERIGEMF
ncbi:MAG: LacI family DNA-binding transcriptional regulator [Anaerovorax sp.]